MIDIRPNLHTHVYIYTIKLSVIVILVNFTCTLPHTGKLQTLDTLLHELKLGSHRVLIFTQMARMLDVLEIFLNYHGHTYLRLDGSTPPLKRQVCIYPRTGE